MCVYMHAYVCMYVWMDGWMDGCMYVYMYIYICVYICMKMYVCMYVCVCVYVCMCVCVCVYIYIGSDNCILAISKPSNHYNINNPQWTFRVGGDQRACKSICLYSIMYSIKDAPLFIR
jgi:hypothetical protein